MVVVYFTVQFCLQKRRLQEGRGFYNTRTVIEELAIRRAELHSNESQHLAEETEEVARLERWFSFVLQQVLSFRTCHHL